MHKLLTLLVLTAVAAAPSLAQPAPAEFSKISASLAAKPRAHPYLLFTAEEKEAMLQRIRNDRAQSELFQKLELEGRRAFLATSHPEAPKRELHTRYVGADDYRRWVTRHLQAALTLAFLYQMTGKKEYAQKSFEYAEVVCAQESWVQSAHYFEIIYPRVWPFGAEDDQVVFSYDITAAGTSQKMAYIYDWLYPALDKHQRNRLRNALLEKAITRVRGNYEYFWWNTAYRCNWSAICHSGLGMAALALLNEDPRLVDVVARSYEGVWNLLENIGDGGGWQEGRGYWAYGLSESAHFIEAVRRVTEGKVDLYKHRSIHPRPLEFGLYGLSAAFSDGSGYPVGESHVMNKLAQESGDGVSAWYATTFVRQGDTVFDLIWPKPTIKSEKPTEASKLFKSIDWAVMRKDFDPSSITIAAKAGMNDDPHHGHLDIGTFNLAWQNLYFIGEVPRGGYDEQFFGGLRWDYLQARTTGHNVVMVNGEEQIPAKLKDEPWKKGIGGKITHYQSEPTWGALIMDPTKAYPGKELKHWTRSIALDKANNIVVVLDRIGCAPGAAVEVRFHPGVDLDVTADRVVLHPSTRAADAARARAAAGLSGRVASARAEAEQRYSPLLSDPAAPRPRPADLEMIALFDGSYTIEQGRQPDMPVMEEARVSWIPYFSTTFKAPAEKNIVASVFYPAELRSKDGLSFKMDKSDPANPRVTYTLGGKSTTLVFGADGITRQ